MTDLFGCDLPVEGGEAGQFVWRDGPLLKALKAGSWIVLDEVFCFVIFCLLPHDDSLRDLDFQELGLQSKSAIGNREVMQGLTCKNEPATKVSGHHPVCKSFI